MKIIKILVFALIISSLLLCCISCGGRGNETQSEPESTEATATGEPVSDWDAAAVVWKAGTDLDFELRVRPGVGYTASERDFDRCDFDVGGKTVSVKVEGMDYVNTFDQLVAYFEARRDALPYGEGARRLLRRKILCRRYDEGRRRGLRYSRSYERIYSILIKTARREAGCFCLFSLLSYKTRRGWS